MNSVRPSHCRLQPVFDKTIQGATSPWQFEIPLRRLRAGLRLGWFLCFGVALGTFSRADERQGFDFYHENVLGTSLELRVRARSESVAREVERRVLEEVDRLGAILSTYSATSEISRWLATRGEPRVVSSDLFRVLELCDGWRERSGGVFNPGVEGIWRMWQRAARQGEDPSISELDRLRKQMNQPPWSLDHASRTATRLGDGPVTVNALAKGYILDRAGAVGMESGGDVDGLLLNIGGDLRVWGNLAADVRIMDPRHDAENAEPIERTRLARRSIATTGDYRRGLTINGRRLSHVIDPRTARPAEGIISATVIAGDSATAGALSTLFSLVPPTEVMRLIPGVRDVEWFLVESTGRTQHSPGWTSVLAQTTGVGPGGVDRGNGSSAAGEGKLTGLGEKGWATGFELRVDLELNQPEGGRYARPYVAIWIEDKDGFPVRTLALWLLTTPKGQRWVPDLRRWYRSDQMRGVIDPTDLVSTLASATRKPGRYSVVWDGLDDHKKLVKAGEYTLLLEAVREHGTYQLIRKELMLGDKDIREELKGNEEIKSARIEYSKRVTP